MVVIAFTQRHCLRGASHTSTLGINLCMYNIWEGCSFGLPQAICVFKCGNYNLTILKYIKIMDAVYCYNCL